MFQSMFSFSSRPKPTMSLLLSSIGFFNRLINLRHRIRESTVDRRFQAAVQRENRNSRNERNNQRVFDHALTFFRNLEFVDEFLNVFKQGYRLQSQIP